MSRAGLSLIVLAAIIIAIKTNILRGGCGLSVLSLLLVLQALLYPGSLIPNAHIIQTKDIEEKIVQMKAEIVGIAGSYVENRQRKYGQFLPIDWT